MEYFVVFSDGGSRGNPGDAGYGYVIYKIEGEDIDFSIGSKIKDRLTLIDEDYAYIGQTTNNQAEWQGVVAAVEKVLNDYGPGKNIIIYLDSELVVKQVKGIYKVKKEELKLWHSKIKQDLLKFSFWDIIHVRREFNKEADALANKAMDEK